MENLDTFGQAARVLNFGIGVRACRNLEPLFHPCRLMSYSTCELGSHYSDSAVQGGYVRSEISNVPQMVVLRSEVGTRVVKWVLEVN